LAEAVRSLDLTGAADQKAMSSLVEMAGLAALLYNSDPNREVNGTLICIDEPFNWVWQTT